MAKDALAQLAGPVRNHANANAERLELANQIAFWRARVSQTTDPMRLASYRRIITDLRDLAERMEGSANG